ncbi:head-tail connector protein [Paracidovorax avenae]|uniref:head-tail connector protein n=1 Tax=Paracidovorax avenae TaxID=80867 RepID=UPI00336A23D9
MPALLTLADAKLHCRIDDDAEDLAIQAIVDAATAAVADYLNMDLDDVDSDAPAPVKSAALLLVADLYANREASSERPLVRNPTFALLLNPYRLMEA